MFIAPRLRKIREIRGWKQSAVAAGMRTTQQAYSALEQGLGCPKIETLNRFCEVMNVELHFLMAADIPVTEENLEKYAARSFYDIISESQQLQQKIDAFNLFFRGSTSDFSLQNILGSGTIAA